MSMGDRISRLGALTLLLLGLGACEVSPGLMVATAGLISYVHTDKTLTDHAVSSVTEENCSVRHVANNEPYCQNPNGAASEAELEAEAMLAQAYCYRTLGAISCYREPDPSASAQARVNW